MPQPLGVPAGLLARRVTRRPADGSQERRLVRGLLLGPHGRAVRAGRHEHYLDGDRRRAHRDRENPALAAYRHLHRRRFPPRAGRPDPHLAPRDSLAHPARRTTHADDDPGRAVTSTPVTDPAPGPAAARLVRCGRAWHRSTTTP